MSRANHRRRGGSSPRSLLAAALLLLPGSASAIPVVQLEDLPVIAQHDAAFDRNAADGNQNGEMWCAPVAAAATLLWLAERYDRPDVVPTGPDGRRFTTQQFVYWLATRWFDTSDVTGTSNNGIVRGLWGYLRTTPYTWRMDVYAAPGTVVAFDGPTFGAHATFRDLYEQMLGEDLYPAAPLLAYRHVDADGNLVAHAVALQQLDNETDSLGRYPGRIMDPYVGRIDDVGFDAANGLDTSAQLYDFIAWRDVYLAIAIAPVPIPGTLLLLAGGLVVLAGVGRRTATR